MKLNDDILLCQKLWADKDLSFGCILQSNYDDSYHFLIKDKKDNSNIIYQVWLQQHSDYSNEEDMLDSYTIIWHPIRYSRLCYLYRSQKSKSKIFMDLTDKFIDNPELYNQSILERPEGLQLLVRDFLLSIQ